MPGGGAPSAPMSAGESCWRSDATTLARAAAVMRDRGDIANRGDVEARRLDRAQRRFAARARARDLDFQVRMPCSDAFFTASSAAIWAANGVDLRDPLKPIVPADDHEIVLPWASVMVIIVLLKVELTCATPETMFLRSRRRTRVASLAITKSQLSAVFRACERRKRSSGAAHYFFLPAIGLALPLRVRALVWVRWPRTGNCLRWRRPR